MEVLASGAALAAAEVVAEQSAGAQQTAVGPVTLNWLGNDTPRLATGVTWGVPFARGTVSKKQTFSLASADGEALPLQTWPLAYWPDGIHEIRRLRHRGGCQYRRRIPHGARPRCERRRSGNRAHAELRPRSISIQARSSAPSRKPVRISSDRSESKAAKWGGRAACSAPRKIAPSPGTLTFDDYLSDIRSVTVEQSGPVRAVVKIEGVHKAAQGTREWLPFTVRLYFYAGQEKVRLIHSVVFDGDQEKDFIKGMGVAFARADARAGAQPPCAVFGRRRWCVGRADSARDRPTAAGAARRRARAWAHQRISPISLRASVSPTRKHSTPRARSF